METDFEILTDFERCYTLYRENDHMVSNIRGRILFYVNNNKSSIFFNFTIEIYCQISQKNDKFRG